MTPTETLPESQQQNKDKVVYLADKDMSISFPSSMNDDQISSAIRSQVYGKEQAPEVPEEGKEPFIQGIADRAYLRYFNIKIFVKVSLFILYNSFIFIRVGVFGFKMKYLFKFIAHRTIDPKQYRTHPLLRLLHHCERGSGRSISRHCAF